MIKPLIIKGISTNSDILDDRLTTSANIRRKINDINALPPLPGMAQRILLLGSDPFADSRKLGELIELDPVITTHVIRWTSSAFYGYRGKITSVQEAINRVLGFDFVFNLALGLSALAPLKGPIEGPIGIKMFWTHALASTYFLKALNEQMPASTRLEPKEVFLAALLRNIGFPLLGHMFPEDFKNVESRIIANPTIAILDLENEVLGIDHAQLGSLLMGAWCLPKPLIDSTYNHHNPNYCGDNDRLTLLIFLCDCLLARLGIGDALNQICPDEVFDKLQISPVTCQELLDKWLAKLESVSVTVEIMMS